jgi:AcrR family transcriptional regulator
MRAPIEGRECGPPRRSRLYSNPITRHIMRASQRIPAVPKSKRAPRMSPEARREHILDAGVKLIVRAGDSRVPLEQVATAAGVSTPLVYKYFPRREDLVRAIMTREFADLAGRGLDTIPRNVPIERVIRGTVERALTYYAERGPIVRILAGDPALAREMRAGNRGSRVSTTDYFVRRFVEVYGVPEDVATVAVIMVVNAPTVSMGSIRRRGVPTERVVDVWSEFIIGGWKALSARFGAEKSRPKKRK